MKVDPKELKEEGIFEFLSGLLDAKKEGGLIDIGDVKVDRLKAYVKKFLHKKGVRDSYKIRVSGGVLSFKPVEKPSEE